MSGIVRPTVDIEAKRADIMEHINEVYDDYERQELQRNIQHEQCLNRNVLLVGLPKSGKTTLKHILDDPRYVSEELSLHSSSEEVSEFEFTISPPSSRLTLNILEIPGKMINATSDLSQINQLCADHRVNNFHLICFCASFHTGIDGYVIQSFVRLIKHLGGEQLSPHLCLIVTRCESKDEDQREKLRNELMQDVHFASVIQYLGRGIHFSGALNRDDWNRASEALYHQFETVYSYRKNIFDLLEDNIKPFDMRPQQRQLTPPVSPSISGNINGSIDAQDGPVLPAPSPPVTLTVQSSPQLPRRPLISAQTQVRGQLPVSTSFLRNPEKPLLSHARSAKPTGCCSSIRAYVVSFSRAISSP